MASPEPKFSNLGTLAILVLAQAQPNTFFIFCVELGGTG